MRLLEFQAKRLLAEHGIPVPKSVLIEAVQGSGGLFLPAVLKAQVPVGGRGKAGGIRLVSTPEEAQAVAAEMLGSTLKGYPVRAVLAEERTEINRELYLALLFDKRTNRPLLMASTAGGVEIEEVARRSPELIVSRAIDPFVGLQPHTIGYLAKFLGLGDRAALEAIVRQMVAIQQGCDATLVEINPLAETPLGLRALDAKIVLDDKAAYRHTDLFVALRAEQQRLVRVDKTWAEEMAEAWEMTYVPLDGEIGMIADGAGTGMLTVDLIHDAGGRAANFCELGGLANAEVMCRAIEVVLANPKVKALLISLIGGLTRMDEMADGVAQYLAHDPVELPIVIRMYGTKEEEGKATLHRLGLATFADLPAAVQQVVSLAKVG